MSQFGHKEVAPPETEIWRDRAHRSAREASLAARALQTLLSSDQRALSTDPLPVPVLGNVTPSESIQYNIEEAKRHEDRYVIRGWAFLRSSLDCRRNVISCVVQSKRSAFAIPVQRLERPDVAEAFPSPNNNRGSSGFHCQFESRFLPEQTAEAYIVIHDEASGVHVSPLISLRA